MRSVSWDALYSGACRGCVAVGRGVQMGRSNFGNFGIQFFSESWTSIFPNLTWASCTELPHLWKKTCSYSKAFMVRNTPHFCLFEVHLLHTPLVNDFTTMLSFTEISFFGANDLLFFRALSFHLSCANSSLQSIFLCFRVLRSSSSYFAANITTLSSWSGRTNVSRSLLTRFVDIFQSKEYT